MNWQDKTRGGYPVRNFRESGITGWPIKAEIFEGGEWGWCTLTNRGEWSLVEPHCRDLMPMFDWQEQALAAGWSPPDTAAYHRKTAEMLDDGDINVPPEKILAARYPGEWG